MLRGGEKRGRAKGRHMYTRLRMLFVLVPLLLVTFLLPTISAPKLPPAVLYSTLLNGITLFEDGRFSMTRMNGYFIPRPQTSTGSQYLYNPDDGAKMNAVIKDSSGQAVCTFGVYAMPHDNVQWRLDTFRNLADKSLDYQFTQPGDYSLVFEIDGKPIQKMDFTVTQSGSDDPYGGGDKWTLGGDWEDYGYLHIPNASPSSTVTFKKWLRADQPGTVYGSAQIVDSAGKVVAEAPKAQYNLKHQWARNPFNFRNESGAFTGAQLFSKPGSYKLKVTVDGQTQVYPFQVAGGTITRQGRQDFSTNAVDRLEGGRDAWWFKAQ